MAIQSICAVASLMLLFCYPEVKCYWMLFGWCSAFLVANIIQDHKDKAFVSFLEGELQSMTSEER